MRGKIQPCFCTSPSDAPAQPAQGHPAGASSLQLAQGGGRKCLLNECVRWWVRRGPQVLPGGLSTPAICAPIPEAIASAQSLPRSWARQYPRPGQGGRRCF